MGTAREKIEAAAGMIVVLCRSYGWNILRSPENLRTYVAKKLPGSAAAADLCAKVLAVPGVVDGLMWCRFYSRDSERLALCREDLAGIVRKAVKEDEDAGAALDALADALAADAAEQDGL